MFQGKNGESTSKAIMDRSEIIGQYFRSWIAKDRSVIDTHFSATIEYVECYGPVYRGLAQMRQWFDDWNEKGSVLEWRIDRVSAVDRRCFVEWFFRCDYEGSIGQFDGVSVIEFDAENKISLIKEYQSKHEHHLPYGGRLVDERT